MISFTNCVRKMSLNPFEVYILHHIDKIINVLEEDVFKHDEGLIRLIKNKLVSEYTSEQFISELMPLIKNYKFSFKRIDNYTPYEIEQNLKDKDLKWTDAIDWYFISSSENIPIQYILKTLENPKYRWNLEAICDTHSMHYSDAKILLFSSLTTTQYVQLMKKLSKTIIPSTESSFVLNYKDFSENPNVTPKYIRETISFMHNKWYWEKLSMNPNLTSAFIKETEKNPLYHWNLKILKLNPVLMRNFEYKSMKDIKLTDSLESVFSGTYRRDPTYLKWFETKYKKHFKYVLEEIEYNLPHENSRVPVLKIFTGVKALETLLLTYSS